MSFSFLDIKFGVLKSKLLSSKVSFSIVIDANLYFSRVKLHLLLSKLGVQNIKIYLCQSDEADLIQPHNKAIL